MFVNLIRQGRNGSHNLIKAVLQTRQAVIGNRMFFLEYDVLCSFDLSFLQMERMAIADVPAVHASVRVHGYAALPEAGLEHERPPPHPVQELCRWVGGIQTRREEAVVSAIFAARDGPRKNSLKWACQEHGLDVRDEFNATAVTDDLRFLLNLLDIADGQTIEEIHQHQNNEENKQYKQQM